MRIVPTRFVRLQCSVESRTPGSCKNTSSVSLFLFIELTKRIEYEVSVTQRMDRDRKFRRRFLKFKRSGSYFHDLPEARLTGNTGSFGVNNSSLVEVYAGRLRVVSQL